MGDNAPDNIVLKLIGGAGAEGLTWREVVTRLRGKVFRQKVNAALVHLERRGYILSKNIATGHGKTIKRYILESAGWERLTEISSLMGNAGD